MSFEVPTVGRIVYFAAADNEPTLPAIVQGVGEATGLLLVVFDVSPQVWQEAPPYYDGPYEAESNVRTWVRVPHLSMARGLEPRWWWPRENA